MGYYIIEDTQCDFDNLFLVKSENKKEALDTLWKQMNYDKQESEIKCGYKPHYKKEFDVTELSQLSKKFSGNENCIILH